MPSFDRFDICEAYYVMELEWNKAGWLRERPSNRRRMESTAIQLDRIKFKPAPVLDGFARLSENGKEIYIDLCRKYGFLDNCVNCAEKKSAHVSGKCLFETTSFVADVSFLIEHPE